MQTFIRQIDKLDSFNVFAGTPVDDKPKQVASIYKIPTGKWAVQASAYTHEDIMPGEFVDMEAAQRYIDKCLKGIESMRTTEQDVIEASRERIKSATRMNAAKEPKVKAVPKPGATKEPRAAKVKATPAKDAPAKDPKPAKVVKAPADPTVPIMTKGGPKRYALESERGHIEVVVRRANVAAAILAAKVTEFGGDTTDLERALGERVMYPFGGMNLYPTREAAATLQTWVEARAAVDGPESVDFATVAVDIAKSIKDGHYNKF
jgi:hypothetical protein